MYLLITIIAALLVGLVLVLVVQQTLGKPEPTERNEVAEGYTDPSAPRFPVVRRGYDIAAVDHYLAMLETRLPGQLEGKETPQ